MRIDELETPRLRLRAWRPEDRAAHAALNADPRVMEFFPATRNRAESDASADLVEAHFARHGFGFWVLELPGVAPFAGLVGLNVMTIDVPFAPAVEVGWRIAYEHWGQGYAPEAARACLDYGFGARGFDEIVAVTAVANARSRRVMEKLGMTHDPAENFEHPSVPTGSSLREHVLYRLRAPGR
jgi:RimJ/RimL family protein N-acetyltransferase